MIRRVGALATLLPVALVGWMGVDLALRGAAGFYPGYLVEGPRDLGRAGGIGPLLVSTALVVTLAVALAAVASLAAAVLATELLGLRLRGAARALLDVGVGVPRIVWGLFGGVVFGGLLGWGFSVATGVATLACLLAPILTTGFLAGLEAVDPALGDQCAALGVSRWTALWTQVIPAAGSATPRRSTSPPAWRPRYPRRSSTRRRPWRCSSSTCYPRSPGGRPRPTRRPPCCSRSPS